MLTESSAAAHGATFPTGSESSALAKLSIGTTVDALPPPASRVLERGPVLLGEASDLLWRLLGDASHRLRRAVSSCSWLSSEAIFSLKASCSSATADTPPLAVRPPRAVSPPDHFRKEGSAIAIGSALPRFCAALICSPGTTAGLATTGSVDGSAPTACVAAGGSDGDVASNSATRLP